MKSPFLAVLVLLLLVVLGSANHLTAQQSLITSNSELSGAVAAPGSSGGVSIESPTLTVYPSVAKRIINVRFTGLPSGTYIMGFRRQDGTLLQSWSGVLVEGNPYTIEIEKVETGIITFFIEFGGSELSASFLHQ
jgi:hypothetical protein